VAVEIPNRRQVKQERTRALLLEAAARVFARRGYHVATTEEVAAEAGFTKGAVYSNFESKDALFLALVDQEIRKRVREIGAVVDAGGSGAEIEAEAERQFQRFVREEPHWPFLFYEFFAYGARRADLRAEFVKRRRAVHRAIADGIRGQADDWGVKLPIPAEQIAVAFEALMNGLAFNRVLDPKSVPDGVFGLTVSRLLYGLLAAPPTEPAPRASGHGRARS
jgi:AcrR family transcriptional regulator